jgi:hypothetical protein
MDRLATGRTTGLDRLWLDPARIFAAAGLSPDPWQARVLSSHARQITMLCSRQAGKSTVAAALALKAALLESPCLVLVVSPSERQSAEAVRKVRDFYEAMGGGKSVASRPALSWYEKMAGEAGKDEDWSSLPRVARESALQLHLSNGSRIIGLPGMEATVRGYSSVGLMLIDEAARVNDALYRSMRPVLGVSGGRLVTLSTPFGQRGWFWKEWEHGAGWERYPVRADECPRISPEFLAEEEQSMGPRWYRQEYELSFEAATDAVFDPAAVRAAVRPGGVLFGG